MLTLTTDFGDSHYVGAVKGAVLRVHPGARIVDITHGVPRHDVRAGAFALVAAAPSFPDGTIHVAVVDPGVGGPRRPLVVECLRGVLVGPDNGLLMPAARALGLLRVRELTNRAWMGADVSSTFHARDVFGPAAAHLDRGAKPSEAGPEVRDAKPLDFGQGRVEQGLLVGEVVLADRFGNCVTNIPGAVARTLLRHGEAALVEWAGGAVDAVFRTTYGEAAVDEPMLLVGSAGYLELAVREGSFAELSGLEAGMEVRIRGA